MKLDSNVKKRRKLGKEMGELEEQLKEIVAEKHDNEADEQKIRVLLKRRHKLILQLKKSANETCLWGTEYRYAIMLLHMKTQSKRYQEMLRAREILLTLALLLAGFLCIGIYLRGSIPSNEEQIQN